MKKSLVALAALAVAGVASAQSSVTLFGIVDVGISNYSTKSTYHNPVVNPFAAPSLFLTQPVGVKQSQTSLSNSGYNSSRIGFRGTEDLGGGLAASFWLETGINNDDGSKGINNFNRRSTLSLSGGFGELRLGRDYTPTFWNDTVFDPFGTNGVGTNLISNINNRLATSAGPLSSRGVATVAGVTRPDGTPATVTVDGSFAGDNYVRTSNSIGYFLPPNLGGFYGQVQYALHENVKRNNTFGSPSTKGRYVGGRFGYANGPLDVAISYGQSTAGDDTKSGPLFSIAGLTIDGVTGSTKRKINTFNLGASYDFGPAKLFGEISRVQDKKSYTGVDTPAALQNPLLPAGFQASGSIKDKYNGYLLGVTVPVGAGLIRASYSTVKFKNGAPQAWNLNSLWWGDNNRNSKANQFAIGYVHNLSKRTALYATLSRIRIKDGWNNPGVMGATTGGSPGYVSGNALWAPRTATGYDFGIRHAF